MMDAPLYIRQHLPGIDLIPAPVQVLGSQAELDDEIARQVFRLDLAALFPPKAEEGSLVIAHDDTGVRAADKITPIRMTALCGCFRGRACDRRLDWGRNGISLGHGSPPWLGLE